MKVLVIGSGGCEYVFCWYLSECGSGYEIYCVFGNVGMECYVMLVFIVVDEIQVFVDFVMDLQIDLMIVGLEFFFFFGFVDEFCNCGFVVYGLSCLVVEFEVSKIFVKEFMQWYGVLIVDFEVVYDVQEVVQVVEKIGLFLVMKVDGFVVGKGVFIVWDQSDFDEVMEFFFEQKCFGMSGVCVFVELFIVGEEVFFMGFCDGQCFLFFVMSKDYKCIGEGDVGVNIGGMGVYSFFGIVDVEQLVEVFEKVMCVIVVGMVVEGNLFVGIFYVGLMMLDEGLKVFEFNVCFGDLEVQVLFLCFDQDLGELLFVGVCGDFGMNCFDFCQEVVCCFVFVVEGYLEGVVKGVMI